jgi:hypothetical protein
MITKFKIFENIKPEIDENTIRMEIKERECYIDFYFDNKGNIVYIDNKWHIRIPEWGRLKNNALITIKNWAKKYDPRSDTYYILKNDTNKYNL